MNYLLLRTLLGVLWAVIVLCAYILAGRGLFDSVVAAIAAAVICLCATSIVVLRRSYRELLLKNARASRAARIIGIVVVVMGALGVVNALRDLISVISLFGVDLVSKLPYTELLFPLMPGAALLFAGLYVARSNASTQQRARAESVLEACITSMPQKSR